MLLELLDFRLAVGSSFQHIIRVFLPSLIAIQQKRKNSIIVELARTNSHKTFVEGADFKYLTRNLMGAQRWFRAVSFFSLQIVVYTASVECELPEQRICFAELCAVPKL